MKKYSYLILLVFFLSGCKNMEPKIEPELYGRITGIIKDKVTGDKIENASVIISNGEGKEVDSPNAGDDGIFTTRKLESGNYRILVTKDGYKDFEENDVTIDADDVTTKDILMEAKRAGLSVNKSIVEFNCTGTNQESVYISNSLGQGNIDFVIQVQETAKYWLKVNKTGGSVKDKIDFELVISVDCQNLGFGDYTGVITLQNAEVNEKIIVNLKKANPNAPSVSIGEQVASITKTSAAFTGTILSEGDTKVTDHGFVWAEFENPTSESKAGMHSKGAGSTGTFTGVATGLKENTTYYVRAFAKNSQGVQYSENRKFKTAQTTTAPAVTIVRISDITQKSAKVIGIISDNGGASITEVGVRYGINENNLDKTVQASAEVGKEFTIPISGLNAGVTYYAIIYAKNTVGTNTSTTLPFTTESTADVIDIQTGGASNVKETSATVNAQILAFSGAISQHGFVYSRKNSSPTISNSEKIELGAISEVGVFSFDLLNLKKGTLYYVRAFATTKNGKTFYGISKEIVTKELGLILYYPLNGDASDVSGNGNNGESFAANWEDRNGNENGAMDIGRGQINFGHEEVIGTYRGDFSFNFWIKTSSSNFEGSGKLLMGKECRNDEFNYGSYNGWVIYTDPTRSRSVFFRIRSSGDVEEIKLFSDVDLVGSWHNISIIKSGEYLNVYLDGLIFSTNTISITADGKCYRTSTYYQDLRISYEKAVETLQRFNGVIDDFRIYNYALSASEVADIYIR